MTKLALITGATSGIGEALCKRLAKQQTDLIITGRDEPRLQELVEALQSQVSVTPILADLADPSARRQIVKVIEEKAPNLVINNAGFGLYGEMSNQDRNEILEMIEVNCSAVTEFTVEAIKALEQKQKAGVIMNISSAAAFLPFPCFALYASTKAFVNHLSLSLDEEVRSKKIRVLASCPGMVKTRFRKRAAKRCEVSYSPKSMEVEEAVENIMWQIKKGKQLHVFNWKTRLGIWLGKWLLPRKVLMKQLRKSIEGIIETKNLP